MYAQTRHLTPLRAGPYHTGSFYPLRQSEVVDLSLGILSSLTLVLLALTGRRGEGRYVPAMIRTS